MWTFLASTFILFSLTIQPLPAEPGINPVIQPQLPPISRCYVGGCSGELCTSSPDAVSTCVYREEFSCLSHARCEVQESGQCGWTHTPAYQACLGGGSQPTPPVAVDPNPPVATPTPLPALPTPTPNPGFIPTLPLITCTPRPPCIDTHPRCLLAPPENGWCDPHPTITRPTPTSEGNNPTPTTTPSSTPTITLHPWFPQLNLPPGISNNQPLNHLKPNSPVFTAPTRFSQSLQEWWHGFSSFLTKSLFKVF